MSFFDRAARFLDELLLLPDDVRASLERAEAMLAAGRPRDAEAAFRAILEARPQLPRALFGWARALVATGDLHGARVALAEARAVAPDDPRIALLAAELALEAGELAAALSAAREAARRLADSGGRPFAEACALRARIEARRGRPDRAARELRKAVAVAPDDVGFRVELIEAFADARERNAALRTSRELPADLDDAHALRVGLALARVDEAAAAEPLLARAASRGDAPSLAALARLTLTRGDLAVAERHARMAIARGGGGPALALLARILEARVDAAVTAGTDARTVADEAFQALLAAASATQDVELFLRACRTVPLRDAKELDRVADIADRNAPGLAIVRTLRAWSLILRDQRDAARALLTEPLREPRAHLAVARLAMLESAPAAALAALDRLDGDPTAPPLGSDAGIAAELRREALRALWRGVDGEVDLAAAIDGVASFTRERALADEERRALALRDELDRPLLLAVLGEFNAGKSTLVNAFLGADVAPTGILPTTATLNVLRGGAERRVRVVRNDGTTREGSHDDLRSLLADAESTGVDRVEIVLPSELLDRVWILDTPGSNAPNPEHEALAREALRRADVALWIFDAGQAGKATEGRILAGIRESKREVLAALNKVDRLKPDDLARVQAALVSSMPELGSEPVALSARAALRARLAHDDAAYEASGFPALLRALEERVFARSRLLKRRACAGRLLSLLDDALATEPASVEQHALAIAEARTAIDSLRRLGPPTDLAIERAIDEVDAGQNAACVEAAREVLAFVRPRVGRFGTHDTDLEDRAFLGELLVARLEQVADRAATTLADQIASLYSAPAFANAPVRPRVRAAVVAAFAHFVGFQSGRLDGGALRRFFDEALPNATLAEAPIAEALAATRAPARELLRPLLDQSLAALRHDLVDELEQRIRDHERERARLIARTYEPLRALRDVLSDLFA